MYYYGTQLCPVFDTNTSCLVICFCRIFFDSVLWSGRIYSRMCSLFREEVSACAAVHTRYVMDACDRVRSIILLPPIMGMSFLLLALTRLIVHELKHWVTWSHRTGISFPFLRGKESNTSVFLLNHIIFNSFLLVV